MLSDSLLYSSLAGLVTVVGAIVTCFIPLSRPVIAFSFGFSSGVMLFVSYATLLPTAVHYGGLIHIVVGILLTVILMSLIHMSSFRKGDHKGIKAVCESHHGYASSVERVGFFLVLAVIAHNFPEGIAIGVGFEAHSHIGMALVIALAIHNLPEGIALAVPFVAAKKSPIIVLGYSLLCGAVLPLGTWIGFTFLSQSMHMISLSLAFAAAMMVWIIVCEVFPQGFRMGKGVAIWGLAMGGLFMYIVHQFHS